MGPACSDLMRPHAIVDPLYVEMCSPRPSESTPLCTVPEARLPSAETDDLPGTIQASQRVGRSARSGDQLTALLTSATILSSTAGVNSFSANEVGHMSPSSRFAASLKPKVAYLALNFFAPWKKQTTLSSRA